MMIALALALAASSPAEDAISREIAPCRVAALRSLGGDSGFLDRYIRAEKMSRHQEARQRLFCVIYLRGSLDALEIQKAQMRAEGRR